MPLGQYVTAGHNTSFLAVSSTYNLQNARQSEVLVNP